MSGLNKYRVSFNVDVILRADTPDEAISEGHKILDGYQLQVLRDAVELDVVEL